MAFGEANFPLFDGEDYRHAKINENSIMKKVGDLAIVAC